MRVTLARAASGLATKRHRLGPADEVVTGGYPVGESRRALNRRDLPDLPAPADLLREIPTITREPVGRFVANRQPRLSTEF